MVGRFISSESTIAKVDFKIKRLETSIDARKPADAKEGRSKEV